jgi:hypothetical protein
MPHPFDNSPVVANQGHNFRAKIHPFDVGKTKLNMPHSSREWSERTVLVWLLLDVSERRCFIANYWLGYYLCMYLFPGRSLYCCGRAVDGVMMALSEYKWSIKHAQREREQKYSMCA